MSLDGGVEIGSGRIDEDQDMTPDPPALVQQMISQTGLIDKQAFEYLAKGLPLGLVSRPSRHRLGQDTGQPDGDAHTTIRIAAIRGNEGSSSAQLSPVSRVSHSLPPVVPKQKAPSSSPSNARRNTPVN